MNDLQKVAEIIKNAKYLTVFTGAGISKDSGIPVFRGEDGLYTNYDPKLLELQTYKSNPQASWAVVKEIFYDFFENIKPNPAHEILAKWEQKGIVKHVITQNIDNLHKDAGSKNVVEYHGTKGSFVCLDCNRLHDLTNMTLTENYPKCNSCSGALKPNFIFFGEAIPEQAAYTAYNEAIKSDVHIIIGTTGEVRPASNIPIYAKRSGAVIIEINPNKSLFSNDVSDICINMGASEALKKLDAELNEK